MKFLNNEKFTYLYEALKYWYYDTNGVIDHQNQILAIDIEVFKVFIVLTNMLMIEIGKYLSAVQI
jgi:hypothetical protein